MSFLTSLSEGWQFGLQLFLVLVCLFYGARKGGMALGLLAGIGLLVLVFAFKLPPGQPAVTVMLTIIAVVAASATLQASGGLDVMLQLAERLLRRHPKYVSILAPLISALLTILCGTGHTVYTLLPIVYDVAIKNGIRPERPMAATSVSAQMAIMASPVSVAVVSLTAILQNADVRLPHFDGYLDLIKISMPSTLMGVVAIGIFSIFRGKDLDKDQRFQALIADPERRAYVYGKSTTLLETRLPKKAWASMWIFLGAVVVVALMGAFERLRPGWEVDGDFQRLDMVATIQIFMLLAGAAMVIFTQCDASKIAKNEIFRSGMIALVAVFGISWMAETMFSAHIPMIQASVGEWVKDAPWAYAVLLLLVSKFVNSQAAADRK
ncbi:MAG: anaerobic C4-dicarboxylate transporter, partial [Bifidobacteriaceae bacterium]|nr:anaerobic C4-dicarboxylate transporter [Bifidobacteriaceae bacterium]